MSSADRRRFDWKEIAEVLHIAGVPSGVTFWREVQRLKVKSVDRQPRMMFHKEGSDSDRVKPDELFGKRGEKLPSSFFPESAAARRLADKKTVKR